MYLSLNDVARARNHCYCGKGINITYLCVCVCVRDFVFVVLRVRVALLTQHAKRMRHITLSVSSLAPPRFSKLSHKRHDLRKKLPIIKSVF